MANPYRDLTQRQLARACNDKAGELLRIAEKAGSPKGDHARDVAYLLLTAARTLDVPHELERAADFSADEFARAIATRHEERRINCRLETLQLAAGAAGVPNPANWVVFASVDDERAYDLARLSEEGLMRAVEHLSHVAAASAKRRRR